MNPRSIQRFEPRIVSAATKTTTMSPSVAQYTSRQWRRARSIGVRIASAIPMTPIAAATPWRTT